MNKICNKLSVLFFILIMHIIAFSDSNTKNEDFIDQKNSYTIPKAQSVVKIDGEMTDELWRNALKIELFYEVHPGENINAPEQTTCFLAYDESHLYAAFKAYDSKPELIRANFTDRDRAISDDWVGLVLDTFNDERRAYDIRVNPLGVQMDGIKIDEETDYSLDIIWNSAGKIYDWGYIVELAIPLNSLRFQQAEEIQTWTIDAVRYYPRSLNHTFGAFPHDRSNNCYLCQGIKINGFKGVSPGNNLDITPTFTSAKTDNRPTMPDGEFEKGKVDNEAGITVRYGITPNISLNATINPDFSQVEADALQMDINNPFALYYAEKRPFFVEGADYFKPRMTDFIGTSNNMIYTRTIRNPQWGLKLTGKSGANTFGAYIVRDEVTNLIFPGNEYSQTMSRNMANTSSVFRYRKDIGNKYSLGMMATDREGENYFNRLVGFDGNLRITDKDIFQLQLIGSNTRYPSEIASSFSQEKGSFNGKAIDLNYRHNTRTLAYWARFQNYDKNFRADLGFIPRVDYKRYRAGSSYNWNAKPDSWYSKIKLNAEVDILTDHSDNIINGGLYVWSNIYSIKQSYLLTVFGKTKEKYNMVDFDNFSIDIFSGFQPFKNIEFGLNCFYGDYVDYENTRPAKKIKVNPGFNWNAGRHLQIEIDHTFEQLNIDQGELYTANISDASIVYQLNRKMFIRSTTQFINYKYNNSLYLMDKETVFKQMLSNVLFSYKLNPGTVLFLGYKDNYLGNQRYKITKKDHTVFAKIGYAFQL